MDLGFSTSHRYPGWLNTQLWKRVSEDARFAEGNTWWSGSPWSTKTSPLLLQMSFCTFSSWTSHALAWTNRNSCSYWVFLLELHSPIEKISSFFLACMYLLPVLLSCHCTDIFFLHKTIFGGHFVFLSSVGALLTSNTSFWVIQISIHPVRVISVRNDLVGGFSLIEIHVIRSCGISAEI